MQEPEAGLSIEDISPILGNLQLTIITQEKTIKRLREKIAELERKPLDEIADKDLLAVDGHKK